MLVRRVDLVLRLGETLLPLALAVFLSAGVASAVAQSRDGETTGMPTYPTLAQTPAGPGKPQARSAYYPSDQVTQTRLLTANSIDQVHKTSPPLRILVQDIPKYATQFDLSGATGMIALKAEVDQLIAYAKQPNSPVPNHAKDVLDVLQGQLYAYLTSQYPAVPSSTVIDQVRGRCFNFNAHFLSAIPAALNLSYLLAPNTQKVAPVNDDVPTDIPREVGGDLSRLDPAGTSLWQRPNIAGQNLYFNREVDPSRVGGYMCAYAKAHTGSGIHPAFMATCTDGGRPVAGGAEIKAKFGTETHSGPFNTRIYKTLGFNVPEIEYFPSMNIKYDRRIFTESNSGSDMSTEIKSFGLPIYHVHLNGGDNPFDHIQLVYLKNGGTIRGADLAEKLLRNSVNLAGNVKDRNYTQLKDQNNYDQVFESQIDYLLTYDGSFTFKSPGKELGSFNYNDPAYVNRRDVRGAVILGAFLANYDMRWMNTMDVLICQPTEGCEVKETLSDVGSGLGAAAHAPLFTSNANAADYGPDWISVDRRGNLKLTNFQTNDYNGVIDHLTNDDFKWFARYLEQITPEQYKQALVAAGFTSVEVEIFAQLLAARRDQLVSIR
jgi:hypothetical protein